MLGYSKGSPYANDPFLDIFSPQGLIDMSNTEIDLIGIDEKGNKKLMKAGRKNPYKFKGKVIREIPMQAGGRTPIQVTNPNDSRLRAYNDSLKLYSEGEINQGKYVALAKKYNLKTSVNSNTYIPDQKIQPIAKDIFWFTGPPNGKDIAGITSMVDKNGNRVQVPYNELVDINPYSGTGSINRYKKPVQPVVYQKPQQASIKKGQPTYQDSLALYNLPKDKNYTVTNERVPNSSYMYSPLMGMKPINVFKNTDGTSYTRFWKKPVGTPQSQEPKFEPVVNSRFQSPDVSVGVPGNVPIPNVQQAKWDNTKPSPYVYTNATGKYLEGENTYFPTEASLRAFAAEQNTTSIQSTSKGATATGYKKLKKGGNPYLQQGGLSNLFNYLFEEDEPAKEEQGPTAPSTDDFDEREKKLTEREQELAESEQYQQAMALVLNGENPYMEQQVTPFKPTNKPTGPSAGINPYVSATEKDIFNQFPVTNLGIWGDKSHQARKSDHNTGDAQDFGVGDISVGNQLASKLVTEAKQRNIKYIIFNGKIWNPSISNEWRPYNGTSSHSDHVHVSYNR